MKVTTFKTTRILSKYKKPTSEFIANIHAGEAALRVSERPGLIIDNKYFKSGIRGSLPSIFLRSFLVQRLHTALETIGPEYGFVIFDGYRSKETQEGLFESYFEQIKRKNPDLSEEELHKETRKYVAHPNEPSRFEIPPHNSGGAVDIGLTHLGRTLDMGTDFDDLTEKASTDFFERQFDAQFGIDESRWNKVRLNRRILFHALVSVGYTNWKYEWWHFDIGNCVWAQELGVPWIFDSMAPLIMPDS